MTEKNIITIFYSFFFILSLIFFQFLGNLKLNHEKNKISQYNQNLLDEQVGLSELENLFDLLKKDKEELETATVETNNFDLMEFYHELRAGETFSNVLSKYNVSESITQTLIKKMSGQVDFKKLQPGDKFRLSLDFEGKLESLVLERGEFEQYEVIADKEKLDFKVVQRAVVIQREVVKVSGRVENSLFEAFSKVGLSDKLTLAFADIFSSKIDFNREIKMGDTFHIVFERYKKGDEVIGFGRILAAKYSGINGEQDAYFYDDGEGELYYDQKGESKTTAFLKSPLPLFKVTSNFSHSRMHPVLGYSRPHLGIDLAAPVGTPVRAVADGEVIFAGKQGGYGNILVLKHGNGYETYYAHLQKFASGISKGVKVKQKDVIGYVGMTGITTGPHLDYRVKYNGNFIDPTTVKGVAKKVLVAKTRERFAEDKEFLIKAIKNPEDFIILKTETRELKTRPAGWIG